MDNIDSQKYIHVSLTAASLRPTVYIVHSMSPILNAVFGQSIVVLLWWYKYFYTGNKSEDQHT